MAIFPWPPWDPDDKTASEVQTRVIDVAAWGEPEYVKEGNPFSQSLTIDKSMQRKGSGQDTNDNNSDFEFKKIPTPINSKGEERIPGTIIPDDTVISKNTTWTIAGSPYYVESNFDQWPIVEQGATLTIEPGVVIMPMNIYTFLEVRGKILAEGEINEKIVFTSIKDSNYGGTGGAAEGDWTGMLISGSGTFKNVIFSHGGNLIGLMQNYSEMIKVDNGSIEMENVLMEKSKSRGLYLIDSNSKIKGSEFKDSLVGILIEGSSDSSEINNCLFDNNSEYGLKIKDSASPEIKDNNFENNGTFGTQGAIFLHSSYPEFDNNQALNNNINGILVHEDTIFDKNVTWYANLVYVLISGSNDYPTVLNGTTLILEPDTIIKPYNSYYTSLLIQGELKAEAASSSEIIFTSFKDDSFGGDTNNDKNDTSPNDKDWKDIKFGPGSTGTLDHLFIYYGYGEDSINVNASASVDIKDIVYGP